jgi:two-component system, OmpR family, alkaline phosphatase synthesis response regulator PhoP
VGGRGRPGRLPVRRLFSFPRSRRVSRILLIEDNADLAFGLRNNLEIEGYEVEVSGDGVAGLESARRSRPDLVILDLMLPKLDGFRVLKAIRQDALAMPVLILTARGEEADKVRGLKLGADDYVTKPFGVLEILARVEALLRRSGGPAGASRSDPPTRIERFGDVEIDLATRTVARAGKDVEVAPKEYELLVALVRRRGAVVSRLELMREVWGYSDAVITRTIDTHIAELRRKLEADPAAPRHILTVRKVGYRLKE